MEFGSGGRLAYALPLCHSFDYNLPVTTQVDVIEHGFEVRRFFGPGGCRSSGQCAAALRYSLFDGRHLQPQGRS